MSYLKEIPSCLLNIVILELEYNDVCNLTFSKTIDEDLLDYKSLFYDLDNKLLCEYHSLNNKSEYFVSRGCLPSKGGLSLKGIPLNSSSIKRTIIIEHIGYKELLNKEGINKFLFDYNGDTNPYKVLYFILLRSDKFKEYLDNKVRLYLHNRELYNLISLNKTYIESYDFEFLDCNIILNVIDLNTFINKYGYSIYIENLFGYSYMDSINEITKYIKDNYKLARYGIDFAGFLEMDLQKPLLKKYLLKYFKHLIEYYPVDIGLENDTLIIILFYKLGELDMVNFILNKMINEKNNYFTNVVEDIDRDGEEYADGEKDSNVEIDYKLIKYIIKYLKNRIREQSDLENILPLTALEELKDKLKEYLDQ